MVRFVLIAFVVFSLARCGFSQQEPSENSVLKIKMHLSAFGVESDDFPSIDALIDFTNDSSICIKSFYNPEKKGGTYSLTKLEIKTIKELLEKTNLIVVKKTFTSNLSDQPRSRIIVTTAKKNYVFDDYGLNGEYPLQELYKIVYKL